MMNIPDWEHKTYESEDEKEETINNWKKFMIYNQYNGYKVKICRTGLYEYIKNRNEGFQLQSDDYVISRLNELELN